MASGGIDFQLRGMSRSRSGSVLAGFDPANPIVTCDLELKQSVFLPGPGTDVVNHERAALGVGAIAHDHDMREVGRHRAGHQITRPVILGLPGDRQRPFVSLEIRLQVGDTTMVNVPVRLLESPVFGIKRKMTLHVLMHQLLKVHSNGCAQGTHHHIRAYTHLHGNVAVRIIQGPVTRIVTNGFSNLRSSRLGNSRRSRLLSGADHQLARDEGHEDA